MNKNPKTKRIIIADSMIIAIIVMIASIIGIYYAGLYFSPEEVIPYSGYAISGKQLTQNLLNNSYNEDENKPKIVKIEEQDMLFKRWNKYYVGREENIEVNIDYPIYINGKTALYNLASDNILITQDFEEISSYPRYTLVDGILYNEGDLERADQNLYLFIKNENNIFISQNNINVHTQYNNYRIPKNSIIHFTDKSISYYSITDEDLKYYKIEDIDLGSNIEIVKNTNYTYEQLLINLKLKEAKKQEIEPEEQIIEEKIEEEPQNRENKEEAVETEEEENEKIEEVQKEDDKEEVTGDEKNEEQEEIRPQYIKPEVSCTNFEANVYSAKSIISIKDPTGQIKSPINFEIRKNGKIYLRKSILSSGNLEIVGLEPSQKYNITANYTFLNEEGQKVQKEFLSQEIETKGIDTLEPIELSFENGDIFTNKIQIKNLKIISDLTSEALKGIKKFELKIGNISYKISNSKINEMLRGTSIILESAESLESNKDINYEFKIYDIQGNELKLQNASGQAKTSKVKPTVNVKVKKQDISEVELTLNLKNKDNAEINNYRYALYNVKGELIQGGNLNKNQETLKLHNLDPNQYFIATFYCDYNIEDGNGIIKDEQIGICNFTSVPISILGYLQMNIDLVDITKQSATIDMSINYEKTDSRLIYILKECSISIYEQTEEGESLKTERKLSEDEITQLKDLDTLQIIFDELNSKSTYRIEMKSVVQQGNTSEEIEVLKSLETFTTYKKPGEVLIKNQFVTGSMIDFDIKIKDDDEAILLNKVRMELRDEKNKLIKMENIETNKDYIRLTYEKLDEKASYTVKFYADEYNEGNNDSNYKSNYLLKTLDIYTEPGISGSIGLMNLERKHAGKNLIDVKSEVKWYSSCFNTWGYYDKTYNDKTEELKIYAGKNGYGQYYVYNLQEYAGQTITISFLAKLEENSDKMAIYLQNSKTGANRTRIQGITESEWQRYTYTVTLDKSGYIGFYLASANNTYEQYLLLKELQVELGSRRTTYEKYKYNLEGKIRVDLTDKRGEIEDKDYYIKIENNGIESSFEQYIEINEDGLLENAVKQYNFKENSKYNISLMIKKRDRFYTISSTEFETKGEILGISNKADFLQIQPNGNYIVLGDIDLSDATGNTCRFGSDKFGMRGTIDFQGHKLIRTSKANQEGVFYLIERTAKIENMVFDLYLNHDIEYGYFRGFATNNRGTLTNIIVNLKECGEFPNVQLGMLGHNNYGTIENFIINLEVPLYAARLSTGGFIYNYGTFRNGYLKGQNIESDFAIGNGQTRSCAGLMYINDKGIVENVYSLIHVNSKEQEGVTERSASIMEVNNRGIVKNVYSVGEGSCGNKAYGPTIGVNQSGNIYNCYYFCDDVFTNSYNLKTTKLALYDAKFQTLMLNSRWTIFDRRFNFTKLLSASKNVRKNAKSRILTITRSTR